MPQNATSTFQQTSVWLTGAQRHILFWAAYFTFHLIVTQLRNNEAPVQPDRIVYYSSLLGTFYLMAYGILPWFNRPRRYHWLVLSIIAAWLLFAIFQWAIDYVLHPYLAPLESDPPPITLTSFFSYPSWLFFQYSMLALGFWFYQERNRKEHEKNKAKEEALRAELAFLKSQFNPHFLFNVLHYFYTKSYRVSDELNQGILKLSEILRYSLRDNSKESSITDKVCLSEEVHYLQNLVGIYQQLYSNTVFIDFKAQGNLKEKRILPLILISFVENAFKHGHLTDQSHPLLIRLKADEERIDFFIQNKTGGTRKELSNGIGLGNVKRRLELTYAHRHQLDIQEDNQYYKCHLTIYE